LSVERWNRLHPTEAPRTPYVTEQLGEAEGPIVAVTDYLKVVPDQIARFVPQPFLPLGTDGYGFSDTREALRRHFEVDAAHIVVAVLDGLAMTGAVTGDVVAAAIDRYGIDPDLPDPRLA
jgi:pyruvate dehydrogenase E1 component